MFYKKVFLEISKNSLRQGLFFNKTAGLRPATSWKKGLSHRCFPLNFAKLLRTPFFKPPVTASGPYQIQDLSVQFISVLFSSDRHTLTLGLRSCLKLVPKKTDYLTLKYFSVLKLILIFQHPEAAKKKVFCKKRCS